MKRLTGDSMKKYLSLLCVLALCGCITTDDPPVIDIPDIPVATNTIPDGVVEAPPALKQGETLAGYGRVNAWAVDKSTLVEDIRACAANGVAIYHIEFLSCSRYSPYGNEEAKRKTEECYEAAITECRKNGMWLFVSFANSNTGSGKYGDKGVPLSRMGELIDWGIDLIQKHGKENVIMQPMGETSGSNGSIEDKIRRAFDGWYLVNNRGSRPNSKPSWAKWNAWHPWKTSDNVPEDQIIVSDTGMIIQELCYGLEGKGKPDGARTWAKKLKDKGVPAVVFYHFKYAEHDPDTIRAMGEGVK